MNGVVLHEPALPCARPALRQLNHDAGDSGQAYRMLVELLPEAIWINCGGKVVYANPAAQRLFGARAPEHLVGSDAVAGSAAGPMQLRRLDGALVDVEYFGCAIRFDDADSVMNVGARRHREARVTNRRSSTRPPTTCSPACPTAHCSSTGWRSPSAAPNATAAGWS